jgi:hypothetical protein
VLTNAETNTTRTTTSNDSGQFAFEGIQPGVCKVDVEAQGFKKSALTNVNALVSKPVDLNVSMEIGDLTQTVSVSVGASEALITEIIVVPKEGISELRLPGNFQSQNAFSTEVKEESLNGKNVLIGSRSIFVNTCAGYGASRILIPTRYRQ